MKLSEQYKEAYEKQYAQGLKAWREVAALQKAKNIVSLSQGLDLSDQRVLEVGCGEGSILQYLNDWAFSKHLSAVDISENALASVEKRNLAYLEDLQVFDGYSLPYPDDHFEVAYCSHVIEHVEFPRQLLREIKRVSTYQLYEIPIDFSVQVDKKSKHFLAYGHINIYTPALFKFLLLSEGHKLLTDRYTVHQGKILRAMYPQGAIKLLLARVKRLFIRHIGLLRRLKCDAYTVLCHKKEQQRIF